MGDRFPPDRGLQACVVGDLAAPRVTVREHPLPQSWTVAAPWQSPRVFVTTAMLDRLDDRRRSPPRS
jgi:Zn-dependent protease with chaperone function